MVAKKSRWSGLVIHRRYSSGCNRRLAPISLRALNSLDVCWLPAIRAQCPKIALDYGQGPGYSPYFRIADLLEDLATALHESMTYSAELEEMLRQLGRHVR